FWCGFSFSLAFFYFFIRLLGGGCFFYCPVRARRYFLWVFFVWVGFCLWGVFFVVAGGFVVFNLLRFIYLRPVCGGP
ncbi:hypothetical protein ACQWBR_23180, partial [Salmonella enterica subsp. enterica serovar Infantis]